jgi:hypothetical protein
MFNSQSQQSSSANALNKLQLTESHLQDLRQVVQKFQTHIPSQSPADAPPLPAQPPADTDTTPMSPPVNSLGSESRNQSMASLSASKITPQLPPHWKRRHDKKGKLYYYNELTKKSQWEFPKLASSSTSSLKEAYASSEKR